MFLYCCYTYYNLFLTYLNFKRSNNEELFKQICGPYQKKTWLFYYKRLISEYISMGPSCILSGGYYIIAYPKLDWSCSLDIIILCDELLFVCFGTKFVGMHAEKGM